MEDYRYDPIESLKPSGAYDACDPGEEDRDWLPVLNDLFNVKDHVMVFEIPVFEDLGVEDIQPEPF